LPSAALPYAALLEARPGDAFLTWEVVPEGVEYAAGMADSVVLVAPSAYHGKRWLTGLGTAPAVAVLTEAALAAPTGAGIAGLSLPEDVVEQLPAPLTPRRLERWAWWWTERPYSSMADPSVVPLAARDDRLTALLRQSSSVYLLPGDARVEAWYGLVEHGAILGCLAVERHHPSVPHLASVVVDSAARGRGVGTRLCGTVVNRLLATGAPVVSLAMMQDNEAAAALYRRLGFRRAADFTSGTIPGRRGSPPVAGWQPGGART
jgi:ribosomal protein S18 acetylase RimI-like enzyme